MDDWDVIVIGGGAAGLMAASCAAQRGRRTLLLEKKQRPGVKILMSGGSRCNLTHAADARGIVEAFGEQGRFLHSALAALGPQQLIDLIEAEGIKTKVESTGKVFPASDRAGDVLAALLAILRRSGCTMACGEAVQSIAPHAGRLRVVTSKRTLLSESVIVTTGGKSYPSSGSTGDGYAWAAELGHTIIPPRPSLVPIASSAPWIRDLQGITLPDVMVQVIEAGGSPLPLGEGQGVRAGQAAFGSPPLRTRDVSSYRNHGILPSPRPSPGGRGGLAQRRGSLLFAHFGVSGPAALDVSRVVSRHPQPSHLVLQCDLLPYRNADALEVEIREQLRAAGARSVAAIIARFVPQRLAEVIVAQTGIGHDCRAAEVSRQVRQRLVAALKRFELHVSGTLGFNKAEVTTGGVALDEVDSHTMESRLAPGLFFAGEILDLDGPIGGYNFQAAFSTGWLAGESA